MGTSSYRVRHRDAEEDLCFQIDVCAEFYRITQANLKSTFLSSLDEYAPKMIMLYRSRGGAYGDEMKTLLNQLDQASGVLAQRKATALKGLPLFLREKSGNFLKSCLDTDPEDTHTKGMKMGVLNVIEDDVAPSFQTQIVQSFKNKLLKLK
ncbi:uncharacterized protein LOC122145523 [Tachysurus ichikawai]